MNICCTFDSKFSPYVCNLYRSVKEFNPKAKFYFIVTSDVNHVETQDVTWVVNDPEFIGCCFQSLANTRGMWNSLYIADCLKDVEKVIYIDVDSIVLCDLTWLWNVQVSSHGLAGVRDLRHPMAANMALKHSNKLRFNLDMDFKTFNNSVLVMDLEIMRKLCADEYTRSLVRKHAVTDMMAQNMYAMGDWTEVGREWCISGNYTNEKVFDGLEWKIVTWHGCKPWNEGTRNSDIWRKYGTDKQI